MIIHPDKSSPIDIMQLQKFTNGKNKTDMMVDDNKDICMRITKMYMLIRNKNNLNIAATVYKIQNASRCHMQCGYVACTCMPHHTLVLK